jgi:hypothetical protein
MGAGQLNRIVRFYCRCAADRRQVNSHAWRQKHIAAISKNAITCRSALAAKLLIVVARLR